MTMPAIAYPGGKSGAGVYQTIINQMPPHEVYIEPFAGGAAIARLKRPAARTILVEKSPATIARLAEAAASPGVTVLEQDALEFLAAYQWTGRELVYADPPYVRSARRSAADLYDFELTDADHVRLLTILRRVPCPVLISGYASALYADMLADWRLIQFQAPTRGGVATECLWMNFPEPVALHDTRYLGDDFRERERIKRKVRRWRAKFRALEPREQQAVLSGLMDPIA
jgi:site-specific DNA-adenine methylase